MGLTPKQQRFVDEYLVDLNATQAAIRAGYSEKTAHQIGAETLIKPDVQQAIQSAMKARSQRTQIDQDWVLQRLAILANAKATDLSSWDEGGVYLKDSKDLTPEQAYLVSEVTLDETIKESKSGDELVLHRQKRLKQVSDTAKLKALELIGKHIGLFNDKLTLSNDPNSPIMPVLVEFKRPDAES